MFRKIWIPFLCLLLPAVCGAQGLKMSVEAGYKSTFRAGSWTPVTVTVENIGEPVEGALAAEVSESNRPVATYIKPVSIPGTQARQRHTLYVFLGSGNPALTISLTSRRGTLGRQKISMNYVPDLARLILTLGQEKGVLSYLDNQPFAASQPGYGGLAPSGSLTGPGGVIRVFDSDPAALPDRSGGLDGLDVAVVGPDVTARSLDAEQQSALRGWVEAGGVLVVDGGVNWQRLQDPFFRGLLPVRVRGAKTLNGLPALAVRYSQPLPPSGAFIVTDTAPLPGAAVEVSEGGTPVVVTHALGQGKVVFLAFDHTLSPFRTWGQQPGTAFWKDMASRSQRQSALLNVAASGSVSGFGGMGGYPRSWYGGAGWGLTSAVMNIPQMEAPSFTFIGLFLIAYIVCLVPVNYFVLRKKDKREWAWVTVPAIVLVFSLGAYAVGYGMKGGKVLLNKVALVEAGAGDATARMDTYTGLFSPRKTGYDLRLKDSSALMHEVETSGPSGQGKQHFVALQGEEPGLSDIAMNMWSMRVFRIQSSLNLQSGIRGTLKLTGSAIRGAVENRTPYNLKECRLMMGAGSQSLGSLPAAGSVKVNMPLKPASVRPGTSGMMMPSPFSAPGSGTKSQVKQSVMSTLLGYGGSPTARFQEPVLIGWCEKPLLTGITVNGRQADEENTALFIVHMPLSAAPGSVEVSAAPENIVDSQATSLNVNPYGQSGTRVHLDTGYYVTEAKLPAVTPALKVSALEVSCRASHPRARMSIYAYDWTRSRWAGVISDLPGVTDAAQSVPNPRRFVRLPGGVVRLKVEMMPASGKAVSPPGSVGGMMKGPGMMGAGGGPNSVERLEIAMKGTAR